MNLLSFDFIKLLLLCAACFFYLPIRGRANRSSSEPKRAVIIQMAKLGDMVCTTPLFRALKARYPSCKLAVVGNRINQELLAGNPDVDTYIEFKGIWQTIRKLRKGSYDFGCITGPSTPLLAVLYLSGVRLISAPRIENGISPNDTAAYRLLTWLCTTRPHRVRHYAPREYLRLLEPLNIFSSDTTKRLAYSKKAEEDAKRFLRLGRVKEGAPTIGISPSAGNKIKKWDGERFAELATHLWDEYSANIVIIGGPRDKEEVQEMTNRLPSAVPVVNASEKFSVDGLKALISKLDLFVAVDTGPIYIAEAFAVPTVDITGPIDEQEQPPIGPRNIVVTPPPPREPQLFVMNARAYDEVEARRQTDVITVEMVFSACKKLLTHHQYAAAL